jgi:hypothetical protein
VRVDDDYFAHLLELIAEHGWAVQSVGGGELPGEVPFAYTVGLSTLGHPELIMQGMPHPYAHHYLNDFGEEIRKGTKFLPDTTSTVVSGEEAPFAFITAVDTSQLLAVEHIYGSVDALQVIWPDSAGKLPWDDGYANPPWVQPFLGIVPEHFDA